MTSTLCQSAAMIAAFFAIIIETIMTIAVNVRGTLYELGLCELGACCRKTGQRLAAMERLMDNEMPQAKNSESVLKGYERGMKRLLKGYRKESEGVCVLT